MKYLIRSIKYFIYFSVLCTVIVAALVVIGAVEGNIEAIFQEGYRSVGKIAIFFAVVAAVYPMLGFITRSIAVTGSWEDIREKTMKYMADHRYELEAESPEKVTFRIRGLHRRLSKMFEDRITFRNGPGGWTLEGMRKDVMKICTGLEHTLTSQNAEQDMINI